MLHGDWSVGFAMDDVHENLRMEKIANEFGKSHFLFES